MRKLLYTVMLSIIFWGFSCSSDNVNAAKRYIETKNFNKAEEYLQKEIEMNPYADEGYYLLGYLRAEEGKYKEMEEMFNKSLQISNRFEKKIEEARKFYSLKEIKK